MSQVYFDLKERCDMLEGLNAELETENEALKDKVSDLGFEVTLLRDLCEYDEDEKKDELIAQLKQSNDEKDAEIARLKAELFDKNEEVSNLLMTFNAATTPMETEELFEDLSEVFQDEPNTKMGEDLGDFVVEYTVLEPDEPKKVRKFVSRPVRTMEDGTKTQKKEGARAYNSRRIKVTDPRVLEVLDDMYRERMHYVNRAGAGHKFSDGVEYAPYFGRLKKEGFYGKLRNIILSSEKKVYLMMETGDHFELKWQNDKGKKNPAYGTIELPSEDGRFQCSIKNAFMIELRIEI